MAELTQWLDRTEKILAEEDQPSVCGDPKIIEIELAKHKVVHRCTMTILQPGIIVNNTASYVTSLLAIVYSCTTLTSQRAHSILSVQLLTSITLHYFIS